LKPFTLRIVCACGALALFGCGSSSDDQPAATQAPTQAPTQAATQAATSPQDQAASDVCAARADIQTQVDTLSTVGTGDATRNDLTSALAAIGTNLEKIKAAQANLTPERKQQVQDATAAFGTQLQAVVRQAVAARSKDDAKAQATDAAASLKTAVTESLQPIDC
jgi:hypothetical protein